MALAKLRELRPHVVRFWETGAESAEMALNEEVDMLGTWVGRLDAAIEQGAPYNFTYEGAVFDVECLVVPAAAKNPALATRAIDLFVSPELQANLPQHLPYSPVNTEALKSGGIMAEMRLYSNAAPENLARQVILDKAYWADQGRADEDLWAKFMVE